jgi:hypothetical protein
MLTLVLDSKYNNLRILFYFIDKELRVVVVEDYDKKAFFPMLLKTHHLLIFCSYFSYLQILDVKVAPWVGKKNNVNPIFNIKC